MDKRDQQRQIKQKKQQVAKQREHTRKLMAKVGSFVVAPVLLLFVLYTLFSQGPTYSTVEIVASDHVRGSAGTPVSITVYADF